MSLEDRLARSIQGANAIYLERGLARLYRPEEIDPDDDWDVDFLGHILNKDGSEGKPIAIAIVSTIRPNESIPIVEDTPEPGQVGYASLEELAGYVSFSAGRAGLMWSNAGSVAILSGQALVAAARRFATNLDRVSNGGPSKEDSTRIRWEQFKSVPSAVVKPHGLVYDWLKASRDDWDAEPAAPTPPPPI